MRKDHSFRNKNRYYTIIENIKSWNEMTIRNFFFFFVWWQHVLFMELNQNS